MTRSRTETLVESPFGRSAIPARKGGAGRKPAADTLAFVAMATEASEADTATWTPGVKGLSTKAHNLRTAHPELRFVVRGNTIYGYNPAK